MLFLHQGRKTIGFVCGYYGFIYRLFAEHLFCPALLGILILLKILGY